MAYISSGVLGLLQDGIQVDAENNAVKILQDNLARKVYLEISKVFERIGGKWDRSSKAHKFPYNPEPALNCCLATGKMPEKNPTAFFPTPNPSIQAMYDLLDSPYIEYESEEYPIQILEPSAGTGALADFLRERVAKNAIIDTVEILDMNQQVLKSKGYNPFCGDFLDFKKFNHYNYVIMNPPFSLKGDSKAFMTHVYHAFKCLRDGGELVAIIPTGWIVGETKRDIEFRGFVAQYSKISLEILESGAFKESGTMVETCIICLQKSEWRSKPHSGFSSYHLWHFALLLENEYQANEQMGDLMSNSEMFDEEACTLLFERMLKVFAKQYCFFPANMVKEAVMYFKELWLWEKERQVENIDENGQLELFCA